MKKLIVILLFCSSCVSTEKLLETHTKNQVSVIEQKRLARKDIFKTKTQFLIVSIGAFIFTGIIINSKDDFR